MLKPDPGYTAAMASDVDMRLKQAFTHLVVEVLDLPQPNGGFSGAPAAHALQNLMREAAQRGDLGEIRRLVDQHGAVLSPNAAADMVRVCPWQVPDLSESEKNLLQSAYCDDIGLTTQLMAPDRANLARFHTSFDQVRTLIGQHLPLWWREFDTLVSTILVAQPQSNAGRFGGASAFAAWGSILVNPIGRADPLPLMLTLIHESSHLKLFYAYLDDEITLNDPDERYGSPLRQEGRPMNGVYHAAFVLARMVAFLQDLIRSDAPLDGLGPDARVALQTEATQAITGFQTAHAVIEQHAVLTQRGKEIMAEATAMVGGYENVDPV
ncbi:HEXXH motif-containing putative peptide modification protein [Aliisedimentitalea scapharcae]|uniref:HEXXH motif-containing putative peptide modification protein n=1 Tax=Aliisedimentitalea scapharcae TaxID=1524259 RepID=A0ABZ2XRU8_9RHOB